MPADTAVGVSDNLSACHTSVGKGASDHESSGRIDQHFEIGVQAIALCSVLHDLQHDIVHILAAGVLGMLSGNQESIDSVSAVIEGNLTLCIRAQTGGAAVTQAFQGFARQYIRQRKHFLRFISGIAEHHSLITGAHLFGSAILINALCDVRALAGNIHGDVVLGQFLIGTVAEQHIPSQRLAVRLML